MAFLHYTPNVRVRQVRFPHIPAGSDTELTDSDTDSDISALIPCALPRMWYNSIRKAEAAGPLRHPGHTPLFSPAIIPKKEKNPMLDIQHVTKRYGKVLANHDMSAMAGNPTRSFP